MKRIDKLLSRLMNDGTITITEALAIGAAVRTVGNTPPSEPVMREHVFKYGSISMDGVRELLKEVRPE